MSGVLVVSQYNVTSPAVWVDVKGHGLWRSFTLGGVGGQGRSGECVGVCMHVSVCGVCVCVCE